MRSGGEAADMLTAGGQYWRLGLANVDIFELGLSDELVGIQFADLVASSVRWLFEGLDAHGKWGRSTRELAAHLLPALYEDARPPRFAG